MGVETQLFILNLILTLKGIPAQWKAVIGGIIIIPRYNLLAISGSNRDLLMVELIAEIVALNYLD